MHIVPKFFSSSPNLRIPNNVKNAAVVGSHGYLDRAWHRVYAILSRFVRVMCLSPKHRLRAKARKRGGNGSRI